jgi:hypothetical protein
VAACSALMALRTGSALLPVMTMVCEGADGMADVCTSAQGGRTSAQSAAAR